MDLLTRGAGFGYLGSTLTSLIYASFTFIFFALEAAVMAYALELAFDIPPAWDCGICALVVIPLVSPGVTAISRLQVWTQPLWLAMLVFPLAYLLIRHPGELAGLSGFVGSGGQGPGFDLMGFGAALTVGIALITPMGEQADYLRFMPEKKPVQHGAGLGKGLDADPSGCHARRRCTLCERDYEPEDMAACPAYGGLICSLC